MAPETTAGRIFFSSVDFGWRSHFCGKITFAVCTSTAKLIGCLTWGSKGGRPSHVLDGGRRLHQRPGSMLRAPPVPARPRGRPDGVRSGVDSGRDRGDNRIIKNRNKS